MTWVLISLGVLIVVAALLMTRYGHTRNRPTMGTDVAVSESKAYTESVRERRWGGI